MTCAPRQRVRQPRERQHLLDPGPRQPRARPGSAHPGRAARMSATRVDHHADGARLGRAFPQWRAAEQHTARRRAHQARPASWSYRRRWPQEPGDDARPDVEGDVVNRGQPAVPPGEPLRGEHRGRPGWMKWFRHVRNGPARGGSRSSPPRRPHLISHPGRRTNDPRDARAQTFSEESLPFEGGFRYVNVRIRPETGIGGW